MNPAERVCDDSFAEALAAFDEALAAGTDGGPPTVAMPTELREDFTEAADVIRRLERAFPRRLAAEAAAEPGWPALGALGPFRLQRELGRGGFGVVFLATDTRLGRLVALKVPHPQVVVTPDLRRRFVREARAAAGLDHPNIVPLYEAGEAGAVGYLACAYCPGPTLAQWLRDQAGPVPWRRAAGLVRELADAVAYLHGKGVLHRDLKPTNVLLQPTAGDNGSVTRPFVPRLTDFGLARFCEELSQATASGALVGTPAYMAPEQAEGRRADIGAATDVHALGILLYELLTRQRPFAGSTDVDTLRRIVHDAPVPPRRVRSDVPRDLEAICLKCLEKRPQNRYATAADLAADLLRLEKGQPTVARPLTVGQRLWHWAGRRPMAAALAATVGLAVAGLVAGVSFYAVQLQQHNAQLTQLNADLAETARRDHHQRSVAEAREQLLRVNRYADRFVTAFHAREQGRLAEALEGLNDLRPAPGEADLRGFEWHYLQWPCHPLHSVWRGHSLRVLAVAASRDGKLLASGSVDRTVRLWDTATGQVRATLRAHQNEIGSVAFSPDGKTLASAAGDNSHCELALWDTATARIRIKVDLPPCTDVRVAYAPDGKSLACSTHRGFGYWDATTGKQLASYSEPNRRFLNLAYAPDGQTLATVGHTGSLDTVSLWDVRTGRERMPLIGHKEFVWHAAFSPDGRTLASASQDRTVYLWDLSAGRPRAVLPHSDNVKCVAFSPDGRTLAASTIAHSTRGVIKLWDAHSGSPLATLSDQGSPSHSLTFVPGTRLLAAGCTDATIKLLDTTPAPARAELPGHSPKEAWALAFAPDGQSLASGGDDGQVRLWDPNTEKQRAELKGHGSLVTAVAFTPDGRSVVSASYDGTVRRWDAATSTPQATLSAAGQLLRCLSISPDGALVAAGARTKKGPAAVYLWEARTGRELPALAGHGKSVRCVAFSPDGAVLVSAGEDGRICWWETADWRLRRHSDESDQVTCLAFAPDGRTLAAGNRAGVVRLWDTRTALEKAVLRGHVGELYAVAYAPDGRTLASAGEDKAIRLWQGATGRELMRLEGHETRVNAVAFAPDGRTLASADHDGAIKLWRTLPR